MKPSTSDTLPTAFSLHISRQAPPLLDKNGERLPEDPLAETWKQLREAFSRLHGQRLVEVMEHLFKAMPPGEKIWMDWQHDERADFFLRFSNGWCLGEGCGSADEQSFSWQHTEEHAPKWFGRDEATLNRWRQWHSLLHQYTIDPGVDGDAQKRLHDLSTKCNGLSTKDLPLIRKTLLGPVWGSSLDFVRLDGALEPGAPTPNGKQQRPRM